LAEVKSSTKKQKFTHMKSLRNSVQLIGRLGKDPEVKIYNKSKKASFSLATSDSYKNEKGEKVEDTQWHNIVIWGALADVAEKFLKKGQELPLREGWFIATMKQKKAKNDLSPR
jgi:single-strand DNA-binding protein